MNDFFLAALSLWRREMVRFLRQRSRIVGALGSPLLFWLLLGSGFSASFRPSGMPEGLHYSEYFFPGTIVMIVLFTAIPYNETISLLLFSIASITDWLDGAIARKRKLITNFGILMDPLADKILTCSAFIAFVGRGYMPAWMVVIIVSRELAITGLRLLAASRSLVLAAEGFGKHKTISQIVAIIATLLQVSYDQWGSFGQTVFGDRKSTRLNSSHRT